MRKSSTGGRPDRAPMISAKIRSIPAMAAHSRRLPVAQVSKACPGRTKDSELSSRSKRGMSLSI